jgi:hypothetical protein
MHTSGFKECLLLLVCLKKEKEQQEQQECNKQFLAQYHDIPYSF